MKELLNWIKMTVSNHLFAVIPSLQVSELKLCSQFQSGILALLRVQSLEVKSGQKLK